MHYTTVLGLLLCVFGCESAVFRLYTRDGGSSNEFIMKPDVSTLRGSTFDGTRKTVLVIHGYLENGKVSWVNRLREALLKQENINLITTDWSDKAKGWYFTAAKNARAAGEEAGDLINFLVTNAPSSPNLMHIVGMSLGAHAAGFAGRHLQNKYGTKIDRITGLDPAGPDFLHRHAPDRLDAGDAAFVDIIHTDTDLLGISLQIGHIDFYLNGGADQPGCTYEGSIIDWLGCDHMRCPEYFIESVSNPSSFRSYPCKNLHDFDRGRCLQCNGGQCPSMGYYADRTKGKASGKHYLYTNKSPPFSANYYYLLTFKTGSKWFSGISSLIKIHVRMTGSKGDTGEVQLPRRSVHRKSTETFLLASARDVGTPATIQVRGSFWDKWFVESVVAKPAWSNQPYTACFKEWISSSAKTKNFRNGNRSC